MKRDDFLQVRPFPRDIADPIERAAIWERYRKELLSLPGVAVFFVGNKEAGGSIVPADGVRKEFEIAKNQGLVTLPVGATGSMATELSSEMLSDADNFAPKLVEAVRTLHTPVADLQTLLQPIINAIEALADE